MVGDSLSPNSPGSVLVVEQSVRLSCPEKFAAGAPCVHIHSRTRPTAAVSGSRLFYCQTPIWLVLRPTSPASRELMGHPSRCEPVPMWW